ncbi:hypothetical protein PR202_gb04580 [Eleusine coracana subsp. coracana]|uniref:Uncharacterized protein n=1 Tax=Eleusine coracana subsp. coracana TaxID=191504 RepID=A0AAV5E435_ELECO|nr:hypothetical protein PR202_gb04580 [Eleusine coracana subsp. coracana]
MELKIATMVLLVANCICFGEPSFSFFGVPASTSHTLHLFSKRDSGSLQKFWNTLVAIDVSPCRQAMNQETPDRLDAAVRPALVRYLQTPPPVRCFLSCVAYLR